MDPIQPKLGMSGMPLSVLMDAPRYQVDIPKYEDTFKTSQNDPSTASEIYAGIANSSAVHDYNSMVTRVASTLWPYVNETDPNYDALKDPQVTSRGEEFTKLYGRNVMDSPSSSLTSSILEQIDKDIEYQRVVDKAPLAVQLIGGVIGETANPINWLPLAPFGAAATKTGAILSTTLMAGATTNVTNKLGTYGTGQTEGQETNAVISSMAFAGLLSTGGAVLGRRFSVPTNQQSYAEATLKYLSDESKPSLGIKYITPPNAANSTNRAGVSASVNGVDSIKYKEGLSAGNDTLGVFSPSTQYAANSGTSFSKLGAAHDNALNDNVISDTMSYIAGYKRYEANFLQKTVEKFTNWLSPNGRLSRNPLDSVQYAKYHLAPQGSTLTTRVVNGGTNEISMVVQAEATASSQMNRFNISFDNIYNEFRMSGGKASPENFLREAYSSRVNRIINKQEIKDPHFAKVDNELSSLFKEIGDESKKYGFLKGDADSANYYRAQYDFVKLMRNPVETMGDIQKFFNVTDHDAAKIYDALYDASKGNINSAEIRVQNNILSKKDLPQSSEFWAKYGRDDIHDMLHFYTTRMAKDNTAAKIFQPLTGETDIYKAITKLVDQDVAQRGNTDVNVISAREAAVNDLKDLADIYTGKFFMRDGGFARTAGIVAKSYQFLTKMGGQFIANLPDWIRVMSLKMKDSDFAKIATTNAEKSLEHIKSLPDKEAQRLLGVFDSFANPSDRAALMGDLIDYNMPATSKAERYARKISKQSTDIMTGLNGMRRYQNWLKAVATEDTAQSILTQSYRILKGKVKEGSRMDVLYRNAGLTPELAQSIVTQFEKHSSVDDNGRTLTNLMNWDREPFSRMTALIQNEVNNHLVLRPNAADKPLFMSRAIPSIMTQFTGYSIATLNKVLIPMIQSMGVNSDLGNRYLLYMLGDLAMGVSVGFMKDYARGDELDFSPERGMIYALNNSSTSGLFGTVDSYATRFRMGSADWLGVKTYKSNARMSWPKETLKAMGGATGGSIVDTVDLLLKFKDGARLSDYDYERMVKLLPYSNLMWWNWAVNSIASKKK